MSRKEVALLVLLFAIMGCVFMYWHAATQPATAVKNDPPAPKIDRNPPTRESDTKSEPEPWSGPPGVFVGRPDKDLPRDVHTVMMTHNGPISYQALVRYKPRRVPLDEIPGLVEVLQSRPQRDAPIPDHAIRVDQETETLLENLGEPMTVLSSYHAYYLGEGNIVAYDLAQTTGGQAQRFLGHRTRKGVTVEIYRGADFVDRHDIPFVVRDTFIPMELEFIHQWFQINAEHRAKRLPVKFSIFNPDVMGFGLVVARPLDDQVVPIGDANYECAHYEAIGVSTQSTEGMQARQELWFDKRSGLLMKHQTFDPAMKTDELPTTLRVKDTSELAQLRSLAVGAPDLPEKPCPYKLNEELTYSVRVHDQQVGSLHVTFSKSTDERRPYTANATVNLEGNDALRQETAVTHYDSHWIPREYGAKGVEAIGTRSNYTLTAKVADSAVEFTIHRTPEIPGTGKKAGGGTEMKNDADWRPPLKMVPITDAESEKESEGEKTGPRAIHQTLTRPLSPGTFLFDYNRVEHLAALAWRLPLPPIPKGPARTEGDEAVRYQKAAIFSVRQNRAGVLLFEIRPEPKPVLTEKQKRRQDPGERNEPQLYVANSGGALLPCRMLLTEDGRLLELTMKMGPGEVIYTLDDPLMRAREERARRKKLQEGPVLIRPPWW